MYATFRPGRSTFICTCCQRNTRETVDNSGTDLCGICYDLHGLQNSFWDDGSRMSCDELDSLMRRRDELLKKLRPKGEMSIVERTFADLIAASRP